MKINGEFEVKLEIHRRLHGVGRVGVYSPLNQQPSDQTISQPTNHHNKPASQAASHSASQPAILAAQAQFCCAEDSRQVIGMRHLIRPQTALPVRRLIIPNTRPVRALISGFRLRTLIGSGRVIGVRAAISGGAVNFPVFRLPRPIPFGKPTMAMRRSWVIGARCRYDRQ